MTSIVYDFDAIRDIARRVPELATLCAPALAEEAQP
jgi:hypothetical protein